MSSWLYDQVTFMASSFQFETETEGGKLRTNVLAEGNVGSGGVPSGIVSMLSGQEEMFAFRRAVSCVPFVFNTNSTLSCSHPLSA